MTKSKLACLAGTLLLALTASALAQTTAVQAPPAESLKVTPPKLEVQEHQLANGLKVLLHEDHSVPVVAVQIWYHVGSKDERAGRSGFAHLFEHIMFKGSANLAAEEHTRLHQLDRRPLQRHHRLRPHPLLRDHPQQPPGAAAVDGGRPHALPRRLGGELPLRARRGQGRAPAADRQPALRPALRGGARQHVTPPIPTRSCRSAAWPTSTPPPSRTCASSTRTYYVPNNATLVVAGDFDPAQALALDREVLRPHPQGQGDPARHPAGAGADGRAPRRRLRRQHAAAGGDAHLPRARGGPPRHLRPGGGEQHPLRRPELAPLPQDGLRAADRAPGRRPGARPGRPGRLLLLRHPAAAGRRPRRGRRPCSRRSSGCRASRSRPRSSTRPRTSSSPAWSSAARRCSDKARRDRLRQRHPRRRRAWSTGSSPSTRRSPPPTCSAVARTYFRPENRTVVHMLPETMRPATPSEGKP